MKIRLTDVKLDQELAGSEGLDANNISRVRIQYLIAQHQTSVQQIQFADAKAAVVMTLIGLLALRGPIELNSAQLSPLEIVFGLISAAAGFCSIAAFFASCASMLLIFAVFCLKM